MISPINHDPAAAIEFAPKAQATNNMNLPKAIPTEATETCPRGRIIDDSAAGQYSGKWSEMMLTGRRT